MVTGWAPTAICLKGVLSAASITCEDLPKVFKPESTVLNENELRHLLAEAQSPTFLAKKRGTISSLPWFYPALVFAAYTGARRGEVLATRWPDLDLDGGTVTIRQSLAQPRSGLAFKRPKNGHVRTIAITSELVAVLRSHKARQAAERVYLGDRYHRGDRSSRCRMACRFPPRPSGRHSSGSSSGQRSRGFGYTTCETPTLRS